MAIYLKRAGKYFRSVFKKYPMFLMFKVLRPGKVILTKPLF